MRAVILAAGYGRRMESLTHDRPKCLLPVGNTTVLGRLLEQLEGQGVSEVDIVTGFAEDKVREEALKFHARHFRIHLISNPQYREDVNILSLTLALRRKISEIYLFEGDILFDEESISRIFDQKNHGRSVWFVSGPFLKEQKGGILLHDDDGEIDDLRLVDGFEPEYGKYRKLIGAMKIGAAEIEGYYRLLEQACERTIAQYYLVPWIDHLESLPAIAIDLGDCVARSFNTVEDYHAARHLFEGRRGTVGSDISLVDVDKLIHIEAFDEHRVLWLKNKIQREGIWTQPLKVEKNHWLILDGQHRFEAARQLGLRRIPCQLFDYSDVEIWSLRPDCEVNHAMVIDRSVKGDIYPFKTVKHQFKDPIQVCDCPLEHLQENQQL